MPKTSSPSSTSSVSAAKTTKTTTATVAPGFFVSHVFAQGWEVFKKHWLLIWGVQLLPMVVGFVYSMLTESLRSGGLSLILSLVYIVVQIMIGMGVARALIALARGNEVTIETLKSPLAQIGNYFLVVLLYSLIMIGGFILLIIPGIIWSIKFMYAPFLVVDQGLGPMEALKRSSQMTKGIKWDLFAFSFAAAIFGYLGVLALVVGLLITLPVAAVSMAIVYNLALARWQKLYAKN